MGQEQMDHIAAIKPWRYRVRNGKVCKVNCNGIDFFFFRQTGYELFSEHGFHFGGKSRKKISSDPKIIQ